MKEAEEEEKAREGRRRRRRSSWSSSITLLGGEFPPGGSRRQWLAAASRLKGLQMTGCICQGQDSGPHTLSCCPCRPAQTLEVSSCHREYYSELSPRNLDNRLETKKGNRDFQRRDYTAGASLRKGGTIWNIWLKMRREKNPQSGPRFRKTRGLLASSQSLSG